MPKYDGSIRIDTKINTKGADKGISTLSNSLKGFASAVGVAFGIAAVVQFGKAAVKASSDLSNAMTGLQSIAEGQGRSFAQANKFIQEYISDGLVPATNAVTAYKNLLSRGYDTEQIENIMTRLKDAAAFGRQASYSLGDAVQSASEGLKNENSLLVDNAGVTRNVAKMWQEYAKSIGTTANNLTVAQKRQAEYLGIMEETRFQVGDAAKITQTYSGQVSMLSFNFNNLKVALGNAIIPVLQAILPHINAVVNGLTRLANMLASFTSGIFGKAQITEGTQAAAGAAGDLAENVGAAGDAAEKSGKQAQKGLAAFDELNTLADTSVGAGGGVGAAAPIAIDPEATSDTLREAIESALDLSSYTLEIGRVNVSWQGLRDKFSEIAGELAKQFDSVDIKGEAFRTVLNLLYAIGEYANLLIGVVGELMIAFNVPATVESALTFLADALETLGDIIGVVSPIVMDFVENALAPVAEWVGGKVRDAFAFLSDQLSKIGTWFNENAPVFERIGDGLTDIATAIWELAKPLLDEAWGNIKGTIVVLLDSILYMGGKYLEILSGIIDFVAGVFTGDWARAWGGVSTIFKGIWNGIVDTVEGAINIIIKGVNWLISQLNKISFSIPDWVPGIGGNSFGINIAPVSSVALPRLAEGAVIPPNREFMAILGDQRAGKNIEAPAGLIKEMVLEALKELGGSSIELNQTINLDGEVVYRNQQSIAARYGRNLMPGVTG